MRNSQPIMPLCLGVRGQSSFLPGGFGGREQDIDQSGGRFKPTYRPVQIDLVHRTVQGCHIVR